METTTQPDERAAILYALERWIAQRPGPVGVVITGGNGQRIIFDAGSFSVTSKMVDGTFPEYPRVIPADGDKLTVDRDAFVRALSIVKQIGDRQPKVVLSIAPGKVALSVTNPDAGTATEEIDATWNQPPREIGFNACYLTDILAQVSGDLVVFDLTDPSSPAKIYTPSDPSSLFVQMPMRV